MTRRLRKAIIKTSWAVLVGVLLYGLIGLVWKNALMAAYVAGSIVLVGVLVIDTWVRF